MTIFQAVFLAVVQGLTEFLPVSSSGHLVLFQKIFGFSNPPVFFDVLLHLGTLGSIIIFFKKDLWNLFFDLKKNTHTLKYLILGTIPAVFFGYLFNLQLESTFNSLILVAIAWIFFGLILFLTSKIKNKTKEITWQDSLIVGFFQALALIPGISRSGLTISAGLLRGLSHESAFKFSFLLAIPAILGATIWEAKDIHFTEINLFQDILAIVVAGVVGYLSLRILQKMLKSNMFFYFGYYCMSLGIITLLILAML
ncbi:MAG: undecaprenyl-diphosphate phosphatase [Patescibacteria group bacterium]|jgi:undecaprenyl-diphosphatase